MILANLRTRTFQHLNGINEDRSEHASIFFDKFLYVAGGIASGLHTNSMERYNLVSTAMNEPLIRCFHFRYDFDKRRWTFVKPMILNRTLFAMVAAHGLIYAIGGENDFRCLNSVEYYNPKTNDWIATTPMIKPRASAGVAVLNDAIYAVGGSMSYAAGETGTVERFDLDTKEWSMVSKW